MWMNVLQRLLVQFVSVCVVVTINAIYVLSFIFWELTPLQLSFVEAGLGLFKLLWKEFYIKRVVQWIAEQHTDISTAGVLSHELAMNVFNFIVGPFIATISTDSNCLVDAVLGEPSITSYFTITVLNNICYTFDATTETKCALVPRPQETSITITPPWLYSYQCTSAVLTNYVPVLLLVYTASGALIPLLQYVLFMLPDKYQNGRLFCNTINPKTAVGLFRSRSVLVDIIVDVAILTTFGMASPLLGAAIVLKQLNMVIFKRISIGRLLMETQENAAYILQQLDDASIKLQGDSVIMLTYLVVVVCLFWSAMLYDMVRAAHVHVLVLKICVGQSSAATFF